MADNAAIAALVRVELTDEPIIPGRSGTNERGAWTIPPKIPAYLHQGDRHPTRFEWPVPESGRPKPGFYFLAGSALAAVVVGKRVALQLDDRALELVPVEDALAALNEAPKLKAAS